MYSCPSSRSLPDNHLHSPLTGPSLFGALHLAHRRLTLPRSSPFSWRLMNLPPQILLMSTQHHQRRPSLDIQTWTTFWDLYALFPEDMIFRSFLAWDFPDVLVWRYGEVTLVSHLLDLILLGDNGQVGNASQSPGRTLCTHSRLTFFNVDDRLKKPHLGRSTVCSFHAYWCVTSSTGQARVRPKSLGPFLFIFSPSNASHGRAGELRPANCTPFCQSRYFRPSRSIPGCCLIESRSPFLAIPLRVSLILGPVFLSSCPPADRIPCDTRVGLYSPDPCHALLDSFSIVHAVRLPDVFRCPQQG